MAYHSSWKGLFVPKHPEKYRGDVRCIIYRSFLELKMMLALDKDDRVEWWTSEETIVRYRSPVDGQTHRYFPDFLVKPRGEQVKMIEVKHSNQCRAPKRGKKTRRRYAEELREWAVNSSKWEAASAYCAQKGWRFQVMTETDLGVTY